MCTCLCTNQLSQGVSCLEHIHTSAPSHRPYGVQQFIHFVQSHLNTRAHSTITPVCDTHARATYTTHTTYTHHTHSYMHMCTAHTTSRAILSMCSSLGFSFTDCPKQPLPVPQQQLPLISLMGTVVPQPPPLTGNVDPTKIEEIRRTVYVGNLNSNVCCFVSLRWWVED